MRSSELQWLETYFADVNSETEMRIYFTLRLTLIRVLFVLKKNRPNIVISQTFYYI
jgi:hypothetical protein